jgi:hypothetical protein
VCSRTNARCAFFRREPFGACGEFARKNRRRPRPVAFGRTCVRMRDDERATLPGRNLSTAVEKESMAAVVVSPRLQFGNVRAKMVARYNPGPGPLLANQWNDTSPLTSLLNIKNQRANRLSKYPLPGGRVGIKTPLALAQEMHRYVRTAKVPGVGGGDNRWHFNLRNWISGACQNPRASQCARTTYGKHAKTARETYPYMIRDFSPACSVSLASLFDIYYGKVPGKMPFTAARCTKMSKEVALDAAAQRTGTKIAGGKTVFASAACPCLTTQADCGAHPLMCNWIPPVAVGAAAPAAPWGKKGSCVPLAKLGKTYFPGIGTNAGQTFKSGAKLPVPATRPGARYRKAPGGRKAWRIRVSAPALAKVPVRTLVPAWP